MKLSKKFKIIHQKDAMQCGVASLAMICSYYGIDYSIEFLQTICCATNQGVSLKGISDASKELGLECIAARTDVTSLQTLHLPCILHWNQNHFVVLYKIDQKGERFWIADPGKGKYRVKKEEFLSNWIYEKSNCGTKGIVMIFEKTDAFGTIKSNGNNSHSISFLKQYLHKYHKLFIQIALGLLLGCILQLIMPFLTQWIVDIGIKNRDINFIWLILLGEMMIVIGRSVTDFIRRWLLLHISMRINISLISNFFVKLLKLPMSFFDVKLIGDLMQRMGDHNRIQSFLTTQMLSMIFSILSLIIFGIVLVIYNKLIFCIFICGSILYALWISRFLSKRKIIDYELFATQAINQNITYQFLTSMQEIKLQNCEKRRRWEWEDSQVDMFKTQMKSMQLQQTQEAGSIFINETKNILITVFAATAVINGNITLGTMLAIQYIVGQLNSPIDKLMQFVYSMQDVKISLERINEIHDYTDEEWKDLSIENFENKKDIEFRHVSFKHDKHSNQDTLSDISFSIPFGEMTAIVGASGSGKTTLLKLLLRYYKVDCGEILLDGKNIDDYNVKWWRQQCGVVMQDGIIFSETISRNIAVDDSEIDNERMIQAAKIACIYDFIVSLPLKFDTKIGQDGMGLSKGQKQRILIARAVYKNPDFILLDEATNSLDAQNEKEIVENLDAFYKNRTVVVVAHRLSTVKNAKQIIVVREGKIVESGNHTELIRKKGEYFNLVNNQLELGL